jgi:hypothetical protein
MCFGHPGVGEFLNFYSFETLKSCVRVGAEVGCVVARLAHYERPVGCSNGIHTGQSTEDNS